MELRPGYKLTEVGVIPEEWEVENLQSAAAKVKNAIVGGPFGSDLVSADYAETGIPVIRGQNMASRFISGDFAYVTKNKADELSANLAGFDDLIFTQRGTLGQISMIPIGPHKSYLVSQSQMKLTLNKARHSPSFVYHYFSSPMGQKQIMVSAIQTGVPHTNLGILRRYRFPAPLLPEQAKIAEVMEDLDTLLTSLDTLIAKKRDLKQAAMQQLLTGKSRLPGFSGEWEVKRLGDLGFFLKGRGIRKDETLSGALPSLRYGEIYTHHNDVVRDFHSWISPDVAARATLLVKGDLVFAGSGETKEEIGKCVAFVGDQEAYVGGDTLILRSRNCDPVFLGYYLNTPKIQRQKASRGQGDAVVHIRAQALSEIGLELPGILEQTAIAQVLSDMDAELAALETQREKTRLLKHGMMQELLTGRIRLVPPSPATAAKPAANSPPAKSSRPTNARNRAIDDGKRT